MREIVLDTETTGLDPFTGDRLVEIGCVELMNFVPTGKTLHLYVNPERDVPAEAVAVHGLTAKFLSDKPLFSQIFTEMLDFIGDSGLVIHNAEFDLKFLNHELKTVGHPKIKNKVVDTVLLARKRYPGSPANLDALCRRFNIDNTGRELHGALLDSQLLAEVYLEMMGGRQHGLGLSPEKTAPAQGEISVTVSRERTPREPRKHIPTPEELTAHASLRKLLTDPIWKEMEPEEDEAAHT